MEETECEKPVLTSANSSAGAQVLLRMAISFSFKDCNTIREGFRTYR